MKRRGFLGTIAAVFVAGGALVKGRKPVKTLAEYEAEGRAKRLAGGVRQFHVDYMPGHDDLARQALNDMTRSGRWRMIGEPRAMTQYNATLDAHCSRMDVFMEPI